MNRLNTVISVISGGLVLFIAGSAFVLSFSALETLAVDVGIDQGHAWLYPAIIDGAVIVFSLSVLRANLTREKARYPWVLVIAFTLLSVTLNIIHAQNDALARFMAAIPPLALFLSFELLMGQIKGISERLSAVQRLDEVEKVIESEERKLDEIVQERSETIEKLNGNIDKLERNKQILAEEINTLNNQKRTVSTSNNGSIAHARQARVSKKQAAMEQLLAYLDGHPNASLSEMADAIGRSKSTAGVYVAELQTSNRLQKNGQGWEMIQISDW